MSTCLCLTKLGVRCHNKPSGKKDDDHRFCYRHQSCANIAQLLQVKILEHPPEKPPRQHKQSPEKPPIQHKQPPEKPPRQHKQSPEKSPIQPPEKPPRQYKQPPEKPPRQLPGKQPQSKQFPEKHPQKVQLVQASIKSSPQECERMGGFVNKQNSCYFDSLLYALFYERNNFIDQNILYVDVDSLYIPDTTILLNTVKELYDVTKTIQSLLREAQSKIHLNVGNNNIDELRHAFAQYDSIYSKHGGSVEHVDWLKSPLSPFDVIVHLNMIFNPPHMTQYNLHKLLGTNIEDITNVKEDKSGVVTTSYIKEIHQNSISRLVDGKYSDLEEPVKLSELINETEVITIDNKEDYIDGIYSVFIKSYELISTPVLFVNIQRLAGSYDIKEQRKINTTIIPEELMDVGDRTLRLKSVIVHTGSCKSGHYITYLTCANEWYYYNDVNFKKLLKLGTFDDLMHDSVHWSNIVKYSNCLYYA